MIKESKVKPKAEKHRGLAPVSFEAQAMLHAYIRGLGASGPV